MSSPLLATIKTSTSYPDFDKQEQWVIHMCQTLEQELKDDNKFPISIFNVPKALVSSKPEAYYPQQIALGPYHYWHPELYGMGRYKLDAAKRTQKQLNSIKFKLLVEEFVRMELEIRACYQKHLDLNGKTLAWMMAVDTAFLCEFLEIYSIQEGKHLASVSFGMPNLVEHKVMKSVRNMILRDVLMLENQIPLFLLRRMLEIQNSSLERADEILYWMLIGLFKELSPFKVTKNYPKMDVTKPAHLLDFLYYMIVPKSEESPEINEHDEDQTDPANNDQEVSFEHSDDVKQLFHVVWELLSKLNKGPIPYLKQALVSRPVKLVENFPSKIIDGLPGFSILPQHFNSENENSNSNSTDKPPLMEEIKIPSVTQLAKSGVRFLPTDGNITSITFNEKKVTLHLPTINLDVNTEVILRNLVAYEASIASGPLIFTRYTELMNGIIDTEEDAKLLREKKIVFNHLKSDKEVANLWNGMSRSVRLTKVPSLDKVIKDVNKYYDGRWKVKIGKLVKIYVYGSWKVLTFLAAIFLLLLTVLQAFCSVYHCSPVLHVAADDGYSVI